MRGRDRLAAGEDLHDPALIDPQFGHRRVQADLAAVGPDLVTHLLPHLPGAVPRVVELRDERLDLVAAVAEERRLGGAEERQALDPLRGPLGADLIGRDAPQLLGIGLEEVLVEALAKPIRDPLLERVLAPLGLDCGPMSGFDNAKLDEEFFGAGKECEGCEQEFFPAGHVKSNFLCNLGYGDPSKLFPRAPRLEFNEACSLL